MFLTLWSNVFFLLEPARLISIYFIHSNVEYILLVYPFTITSASFYSHLTLTSALCDFPLPMSLVASQLYSPLSERLTEFTAEGLSLSLLDDFLSPISRLPPGHRAHWWVGLGRTAQCQQHIFLHLKTRITLNCHIFGTVCRNQTYRKQRTVRFNHCPILFQLSEEIINEKNWTTAKIYFCIASFFKNIFGLICFAKKKKWQLK